MAELRGEHHEDDQDLMDRIGFGESREVRPRRRPRRPSQRTRLTRTITMLVALVLVAIGGFYTVKLVAPFFEGLSSDSARDEDYPGPGSGEVVVVIPRNASGKDVGTILEKAEVVKSGRTFTKLAALDERGGKLQPGTYRVKKHMSSAEALGALTDTRNRAGSKVSIPEGKWKDEIYALFAKATGIPVAEFNAVKPADVGLPAEAKGNFEGWLFPATYEVDPMFKAKDYVRQMVDQMKYQLGQLGIQTSDYQETLTKASMVQAEGFSTDDFGKVARVMVNRERSGMPYQFDSTIHYAQKRRGNLRTTSQDQKLDSPYNTYMPGSSLPPGPIGNPGAAALNAVVSPPEGDWLYFVTTDPCAQETKFTSSYSEHLYNQSVYNKWQKEHPDGQCAKG